MKNTSLVSGGGKKPYKQKGTGRARQGSIRASQWVGGGKAMGPKPRDYAYEVPKKVRKAALRSALALKNRDQKLVIVDKWQPEAPKTAAAAQALAKLGVRRALVVDAGSNVNLGKSVRNLDGYVEIGSTESLERTSRASSFRQLSPFDQNGSGERTRHGE